MEVAVAAEYCSLLFRRARHHWFPLVSESAGTVTAALAQARAGAARTPDNAQIARPYASTETMNGAPGRFTGAAGPVKLENTQLATSGDTIAVSPCTDDKAPCVSPCRSAAAEAETRLCTAGLVIAPSDCKTIPSTTTQATGARAMQR